MIENATVAIYAPVSASANSEGEIVKDWGYKHTPSLVAVSTFDADVQPRRLTEVELQLWGLSDLNAQAKTMIFDDDANVVAGNRAAVTDENGTTTYYDIRAVNQWQTHSVAILLPVQGE